MDAVIDRRTANALSAHVAAIQKHVPLQPVRTEADLDAAIAALNGLLDAGAGDEDHPLAPLAATLGGLIAEYEDVHHPAAPVSAIETLRFLMDQHGLKQGDLPEIGSQGVTSDVLRGRRTLNLRQIRALAQRFGVPPSVFIDPVDSAA